MIAIRENLIRNKSDDVSQTFHVVLEVSQHIGPVPFGTLCQGFRSVSLAFDMIPHLCDRFGRATYSGSVAFRIAD